MNVCRICLVPSNDKDMHNLDGFGSYLQILLPELDNHTVMEERKLCRKCSLHAQMACQFYNTFKRTEQRIDCYLQYSKAKNLSLKDVLMYEGICKDEALDKNSITSTECTESPVSEQKMQIEKINQKFKSVMKKLTPDCKQFKFKIKPNSKKAKKKGLFCDKNIKKLYIRKERKKLMPKKSPLILAENTDKNIPIKISGVFGAVSDNIDDIKVTETKNGIQTCVPFQTYYTKRKLQKDDDPSLHQSLVVTNTTEHLHVINALKSKPANENSNSKLYVMSPSQLNNNAHETSDRTVPNVNPTIDNASISNGTSNNNTQSSGNCTELSPKTRTIYAAPVPDDSTTDQRQTDNTTREDSSRLVIDPSEPTVRAKEADFGAFNISGTVDDIIKNILTVDVDEPNDIPEYVHIKSLDAIKLVKIKNTCDVNDILYHNIRALTLDHNYAELPAQHLYKCNFCNKMFQRDSITFEHISNQHASTPYCRFCRETFKNLLELNKHIKQHLAD